MPAPRCVLATSFMITDEESGDHISLLVPLIDIRVTYLPVLSSLLCGCEELSGVQAEAEGPKLQVLSDQ